MQYLQYNKFNNKKTAFLLEKAFEFPKGFCMFASHHKGDYSKA